MAIAAAKALSITCSRTSLCMHPGCCQHAKSMGQGTRQILAATCKQHSLGGSSWQGSKRNLNSSGMRLHQPPATSSACITLACNKKNPPP